MTRWPAVPLGEVATIDRIALDPDSVKGGTLYVGLENIARGGALVNVSGVRQGQLSSLKYKFDRGHVLFGKLRPNLAKIARPQFDGICSTDILPLRPGARLNRDYLAYYLSMPETVGLASSQATGVNLPRLSPLQLLRFRLPLPPLEEQRRIAEILDRADTLRAKRREALTLLDDLTQSIFLDMFGDPDRNPRRWATRSLAELVANDDRINYGFLQPGYDFRGGIGMVRVGDLVGGQIRHSSLKHIDPSIEAAYKRSRLRGNEVLVSCVGSIGLVAVARERDVGLNIARAISRTPIESPSMRQYVAAHLRTPAVQHYFINELRTVAQPTLNVRQLAETRIMLPPEDLVDCFAKSRTHLESVVAVQLKSAEKFEGLLGALQWRAFAGEL